MSLTPNLDQRIRYIKGLLEETGLYQYGFCDEEIQNFICQSFTTVIPILIKLKELADKHESRIS